MDTTVAVSGDMDRRVALYLPSGIAPGDYTRIDVSASEMDTLDFAERGSLFNPLGDTGLSEFAGVLYEETAATMRGRRWYLTVQEMLNTSVIAGMMFAVEMLIRTAEWHLDPAEGETIDADAAAEARDFVESCRLDMRQSWEDMLAELISFVPYGFSLMETVYKRRTGDRGEQASAYDDGLIGWDEWAPRAQQTVEGWVFDSHGHVTGFKQRTKSMSRVIEIPMERVLHFKAGGYRGSPEGRSMLRAAYRDWDGVRKIEQIEAIGIERDLAGLPYGEVPLSLLKSGRTAEDAATFNRIKAVLAGMRNNDQGGAIFPRAFGPDGKELYKWGLMSTGGSRQFDTSAVVNRRNTQMSSSMLADFMQIGHGSTGSYALSDNKTSMFMRAISSWCDLIADVINRQGIRRLMRVNGMDRTLAPTLRAGNVQATDLASLGGFMSNIWPIMSVTLEKEDIVSVLSSLFDSADLPAIVATLEADQITDPAPVVTPVTDPAVVADPVVDDVEGE